MNVTPHLLIIIKGASGIESKKDSIFFLTDNIAIDTNSIYSDSDADSADSAKSAFKIICILR